MEDKPHQSLAMCQLQRITFEIISRVPVELGIRGHTLKTA
jgi:hypothetical protein